MKKGFVFIFFVFIFYGCKSYNSDVSSLIETDGRNTYLYGQSTAKDGTSIICRFECDQVPNQHNKSTVCKSPAYIENRKIIETEGLSRFLAYIVDSKELFVREISPFEQNQLNPLFISAASAAEDKIYNLRLGKPEEVCAEVVDPSKSTRMMVTTVSNNNNKTKKDIRFIQAVTCEVLATSGDKNLFLISSSFERCIYDELLEQAGFKLENKSLMKLNEEVYTIGNQNITVDRSTKIQSLKKEYLRNNKSGKDWYDFVYYITDNPDDNMYSQVKEPFLVIVCPFNQDYTRVDTPKCTRYSYNKF